MNKNLLFTTALFFLYSLQVMAQENTWMIYGNASYDNVNYTTSSVAGYGAQYTNVPLTLVGWNTDFGVGYQLDKHFMVGLQGGYGKQDGDNPTVLVLYTDATWQAGIFGRYTQWLGKRFYAYAQLFIGTYGLNEQVTSESYYQAQPYTYTQAGMPPGNGVTVNLFPGIGVHIIQGFGLHLDIGGISYTSYHATESSIYNYGTNNSSPSNMQHFNVTLGKQISFGIQKIIGWRKFNTPALPPAQTKS